MILFHFPKFAPTLIFRSVFPVCFWLFFLFLPFSAGQDVPAADTAPATENSYEPEQIEPLTIKVSVNEVRLDVVVLDKKTGNPITDLTAADFEVLQDYRRQEIKSAIYIDSQSDVSVRPSATRKNAPKLPSFPTAALKEEDVRRTILFVVDDYGMSFENGYYAKMALRNFVEKQMLPGDMVSILRTNYGNRAMNMFQSDKREVLARINALPTTMAPKSESGPQGSSRYDSGPVGTGMWRDFLTRLHENQISTLSYSLRMLKNMPGRKILFMMTPLTVHSAYEFYFYFYYIRLADEALRAGVVVNLLDIDGLYNFRTNYADASAWASVPALGGESITQASLLSSLQSVRTELPPTPNPLPAATGGITIRNSNFFLDGIGKEVESLMKGYYLISYEPPPGTFEVHDQKVKEIFRRLKVKVNRKDAVVHTRDGFFDRLESELGDDIPEQEPLIKAVFSPFQSTDITVNIAAGYVKDAESGYLVRSWIHLNPEDVKVVENGSARIDLETLCVTSDINGEIRDTRRLEFSLTNIKSAEDIAWIQKHGIRFSLLLPVKKPGPYYIRVSVKDKETGKVGSAYQFLEIPDVGKKGMALSNVFMITGADDLNWMSSDVKKEIAEGVFFPEFRGEGRSPALRTYTSGDNLASLAFLYNADSKAIARSEIEMQSILYKDGAEFRRGAPIPVRVDGEQNRNDIPILQRLTIGPDMPPGDYVQQLVITDKKSSKKKESGVYQTLSFTVTEK